METQIELGGISVDVVFKDIKNIHLSVYPPTGRVRISAPERMDINTIRIFAISKIDWIRQNQTKIQAQDRESPREYLDRESHYLWGRRYLLDVVESDAAPKVQLSSNKLVLQVRPGATEQKRQTVLAAFYREEIRSEAPALIAKWEPLLGVTVEKFYVQKMKTAWGSCNARARAIRLNTELAKKPKQCLEYIIVHEMLHILEPTHNARFQSLMECFMPSAQHLRTQLNQLPVRHEDWQY